MSNRAHYIELALSRITTALRNATDLGETHREKLRQLGEFIRSLDDVTVRVVQTDDLMSDGGVLNHDPDRGPHGAEDIVTRLFGGDYMAINNVNRQAGPVMGGMFWLTPNIRTVVWKGGRIYYQTESVGGVQIWYESPGGGRLSGGQRIDYDPRPSTISGQTQPDEAIERTIRGAVMAGQWRPGG